jgi:hypothetical protein
MESSPSCDATMEDRYSARGKLTLAEEIYQATLAKIKSRHGINTVFLITLVSDWYA